MNRKRVLEKFMKKLVLVTLLGSFLTLTACSKPVTEVKKGETEAVSAPAATQSATLSTNNKADIRADLEAIQTFGMAQEKNAASLQQRLDAAMKKEDKVELKKLFTEFRAFVQKSNVELKALKLKSTEADQLRAKMIETSLVGLDMSEAILESDMKNVDQAKMQPLQERAMKAQQELMAISQDIQSKIHDQPAAMMPQGGNAPQGAAQQGSPMMQQAPMQEMSQGQTNTAR